MLPMIECQANGWWPPGCGLISQTQDAATQTITNMFAGILESMASWMWSFISGAFGVSDLGPSDWTAVSGVTNWWIVVMMTPLVVVMILQLLSGMISQQPRRIVRAVIAGGIAVPVVIGAVSLMQKLTQFTDSASSAVLQTLGSDPYVVFMRLFGFTRAPAGSGHEWDLISMTSPGTSDPTGPIIVTVVAVALVWVLAFVLMCSMIFRSFALLVLAATAPVALMLMPWEHTMSWTRRWCETVVALLIAKPLAATVLAVAVKLFANSTSFAGLASGAVGMLLACAAPLMALRLVSFAGGELAGAAQVAGGGHVLSRSGSFAARQISRQAGGKLSLSSLGSQKPTLVPSSAEPTVKSGAEPNLKQLQKVGKVSGQQNMKNDGGQPVPRGGSQPPGSETKTYGQPYIKRAGTTHRDPTATTQSRQPRSDSGPLKTPVSAVSEPSQSKQNGVAVGTQRAATPVPRPVAPASKSVQATKPHPPTAPRPAPHAPPTPRPPRIDPEREKDV